jgi:predicted AAA+ superfamily ATPase
MVFIPRKLGPQLIRFATKFPVVAVVGPRQSGKTTLVRQTFGDYKYFSLEDPDTLDDVRADPRDFLERNYGTKGIIIDEFQNEPKLLSYMQGIVDKDRRPGYFILTSSHNFLMNQTISQSLAGRVALLTLLPLSVEELRDSNFLSDDINVALYQGGYADIFTRHITPEEFYPQYTRTFVERDVRQLSHIGDLTDFQRLLRLCAGRIGQLLNVSSLADDCGISVATVKSWISILEASYIIFLLQPHFKNFSKRVIKSPKLYFYDTGLACWLLKISSSDQVADHYLRGSLFESLIIAELYKDFYNKAQDPSVYFWRDSHGHEIDCLLDFGATLVPIEIKAGKTVQPNYFEGLQYWTDLAAVEQNQGYVVYAGMETEKRSRGTVVSWRSVENITKNR